jgi:hypothetical protein
MTSDDPLRDWLQDRRAPQVPAGFADRVMSRIELEERPPVRRPDAERRGERLLQVLVVCVAAVVCLIRLYSFVSLLVPGSGDDSTIAVEFSEELKNVQPEDNRT